MQELQISIIIIIFHIVFIVPILLNFLEDILFWQLKEYRFDRAYASFRSQREKIFRGKRYYYLRGGFLIAFMFVQYFFAPLWWIILLILFTLIVFRLFESLPRIFSAKFKRPRISPRNIIILALSLFVISLPFILNTYILLQVNSIRNVREVEVSGVSAELSPYYDQKVGIEMIPIMFVIIASNTFLYLVIDILTPVLVSFFVLCTHPLAIYKRKRTIALAKNKLSKLNNIKCIGITGDYGKSSTKEVTRMILSHFSRVVASSGNVNTGVGLAEEVLKGVDSSTQMFIAEMGAYRDGEIRECVEILPLDVALVTNVGASHLDLFGTIENSVRCHAEILEGVKQAGVVILNLDDENAISMRSITKSRVITYSVSGNRDADVCITEQSWKDDNVEFALSFVNQTVSISANVDGRHHLENILAAISISVSLGISIIDIKKAIDGFSFSSSHFQKYRLSENLKIINDSYNSNPVGFRAALHELGREGVVKKVVVTRGIIEMDKLLPDVYKDLASDILRNANVLITSDKLLFTVMKKFGESLKIIYAKNDSDLHKKILSETQNFNSAILLEGRMPPKVNETFKPVDSGLA